MSNLICGTRTLRAIRGRASPSAGCDKLAVCRTDHGRGRPCHNGNTLRVETGNRFFALSD
jgi:hypothetical protein